MLTRLICRFIYCPRFNSGHKRDWHAWDSMSIARCLHCHRPMPEPEIPPRARL